MNRLLAETSPYLLSHAHNPVDWWPWCDEAFADAEARNVPVLLSVGYAACHWCHVMERESFEDPAIAAVMNSGFVCIKVDREQRPDIDSLYMDAVVATVGQGGWPMTVFLTPAGKPFLGGTYFPPEDRGGLPSFLKVLNRVSELWSTEQAQLVDQADRILSHISKPIDTDSAGKASESLLASAAKTIGNDFDGVHGGFGGAPKFPQAPRLEACLAIGDSSAKAAVKATLTAMANGGIYDQLAGGFCRYTVDARWVVPHFEKMLYDNAQLARLYVRGFQTWQEPLFQKIAQDTLDFLLTDMRDTDGGFHSSFDADSEGEEGTFYVWDYEELERVAPNSAEVFGATREGNFEGRNVLMRRTEPTNEMRAALLNHRSKRPPPAKDDKVLTSWNGLTISALATAAAAFGEPRFAQAATEAVDFVKSTMLNGNTLKHSYRASVSQVEGLLEDYAYLAEGLLHLYFATGINDHLELSLSLTKWALDHFSFPDGGFVMSTNELVAKRPEFTESATPSPGGVLALTGLKLAKITSDDTLRTPIVNAINRATGYLVRAPQAVPTWLVALDEYLGASVEIALTGKIDSRLLQDVFSRYVPRSVYVYEHTHSPVTESKTSEEFAVWICRNYTCKAPVAGEAIKSAIRDL